jgi:CTP:molybdopterin cytidylyltransferase MocA
MGSQKLLLTLGGRTLLERALAATAAFPRVLVAGPEVAGAVGPEPGLRVVLNDEPDRGMAHSLRLADAAAAPGAALAVVLADTPFVDAELVRAVVAARGDADVAFPIRAGRPGHPVVFGPRPRRALVDLADGDTLRSLRADPRWVRVEVTVDDDRPFLDVDTPCDFARAQATGEPDGAPGQPSPARDAL